MMMSNTMRDIVRLGGGLDIPAASIMADTAKDLARLAAHSGATLKFRNPTWLSETLKDIARLGKGNVIFYYD